MEIYFDNSATTKCYESVKDVMVQALLCDYGNPSAMHRKGFEAEQLLKKARERFASILRGKAGEIFFTSGGTESNNLAILGAARANRRKGNKLITTSIEHPSVMMVMEQLEQEGFEIVKIPVDRYGILDWERLVKEVDQQTILVSVMQVNNEIGAVEPIEKIGRYLKQEAPASLFHVDAIQSFGKMRIAPKQMGVDLLSISGHKIHGPKGIGVLYVREGVRLLPVLYGGGQQMGLRSGTENVPGIVGMAKAAEEIYERIDEIERNLYELKDYFVDQVGKLPDVIVNGKTGRESAPHIVSVSFLGVRSEVLLHALEEKGIYVSAGSACSSHKSSKSPTLQAIGAKKEQLDSTLRFSFCAENTKEEIEKTMETLKELLPFLRKFQRR